MSMVLSEGVSHMWLYLNFNSLAGPGRRLRRFSDWTVGFENIMLCLVSPRELVFHSWWRVPLWYPLCYFVAMMHLCCRSIVLLCGITCWLLSSAAWRSGAFGGQVFFSLKFLVVESPSIVTLLDCVCGTWLFFELESLFVLWASLCL